MDTIVAGDHPGQPPVVDRFRRPHAFHLSGQVVEALCEKSHAGDVKQVQRARAVDIAKDGMQNVKHVKGLGENVGRRKDFHCFESGEGRLLV